MTKALSSIPKHEKAYVIGRRLRGKTGGLGYLAAQDAVAKGATAVTSYQEVTEEETLDKTKQS